MMREKISWHHWQTKKVISWWKTDPQKGLSVKEVKKRQKKFGLNQLPQEKPFSSFKVFLMQFRSPLIYILVLAGVVTLFLGQINDSLVILVAVSVNALFGFWEENKVSQTLEKLKKVLRTKALVLREGQKEEVFQEELVPGDILFLKAGDKVPADARLIEAKDLRVSEAALTGEWLPSVKRVMVLPQEVSLAERKNMVYLGSLVESGEGKAVVVATGEQTEMGKIATLIKETPEEKTPLQKKLMGFSKLVGGLIGLVCLFIFGGGILRGEGSLKMFETAVAIAVGGIPEALPVVMTVVLVIGMERILKKKGLLRRLASVETLGSTQVICFDKTRTLTQGKMVLSQVVAEDQKLALKIAVLCNEAFIQNPSDSFEKWRINGRPTDVALIRGAARKGILKPDWEKRSIELKRVPFNSDRKYQLFLRKEKRGVFLYIAGAPERVLAKSKNKKDWKEKLGQLGQKGLRVIGVGYKKIASYQLRVDNLRKEEKDFVFAGLIALKDPLRPEVKKAVRVCQRAGMRPILVTGDHLLTAQAIAREIGLKVKKGEVLEGRELDSLSDQEFVRLLPKIKVYARVEPRHKLRIVSAWQKRGRVVAMTGDGVNDAPALKKADIGVALGSGTEVAKESADLILLNDSFSIIIKAIEEGRVILDNLRKALTYVMANSFASAIIVGIATLLGWPLPLLPMQILWNNIVEDTLPNLAFAFEPKEEGIMKRPPNPPQLPLLTKEMKTLIFATGSLYQALGLVLFYFWWKVLGQDLSDARTMVFGLLVVNTAFVIFSYKSLRKNIWGYNPFSNFWLNLAAVVVLLFFFVSLSFPSLRSLLSVKPLGGEGWLVLIVLSLFSMLLIEATKWYFIVRHQTEK